MKIDQGFKFLERFLLIFGGIATIVACAITFLAFIAPQETQATVSQLVSGDTPTPIIIIITATPEPNTPTPTGPTSTPTIVPSSTNTPVPTDTPPPTPDLRLFWDNFETGIRPEWGMLGEGYAVTNGELIVEGKLASEIVGNNTWGDYEIRISEFGLAGCCTTVRFLLRMQDLGNYMQLTCQEKNRDAYSQCFWDKIIDGQEMPIPGADFGIMSREIYNLRVEARGNQYMTILDGELQVRFADDTFGGGGISLRIEPRGRIGSIEVRSLP